MGEDTPKAGMENRSVATLPTTLLHEVASWSSSTSVPASASAWTTDQPDGPRSRAALALFVRAAGRQQRLGRGVVPCHDFPRLPALWMRRVRCVGSAPKTRAVTCVVRRVACPGRRCSCCSAMHRAATFRHVRFDKAYCPLSEPRRSSETG